MPPAPALARKSAARPWHLAGPLALLWLLLAPPALAAIRIEVNGVDGALRRNVLALLSLEHYKDRDRIEPDAVERLFRRVDPEVRDALRPFGYYEPKITATLKPDDNQRNWRVQIDIEAGEPVLLDAISIVIHGPGADDEVFARIAAAPTLRKGERLQHADYEKVKSDLQSAAATYGYLDARLLRSELQVDPGARRASVFLELDTGERYYFGATTITQSAIRDAQLRRYLRYHEGEPFDAGKLLRTQFALDDSQFFSSVDLVPGVRDPVTHIVPIEIKARAARSVYSFGPGYDSDAGVRGTVSWLNPRVNDRGHRLRVQIEVSHLKRNINARYDIPFGDPVLEKFSLQFIRQTQDTTSNVYKTRVEPPPATGVNPFIRTAGQISTSETSLTPGLSISTGRWQRVLAVKFTRDVTSDALENGKLDSLAVPSLTIAAIPEGYLGEDLFTRSLWVQLDGSFAGLGAQSRFLRLDVRSEQTFTMARVWHLLLRGEVGVSAVHDFEKLPAAYRFFAGGDRSVRGFAFQDLSTLRGRNVPGLDASGAPVVDFVQERIGGRHLLTGTVEIEHDLPHNLGVAAFSDFGNAFDRVGEPLAWSVGVGMRWRLPVVTVGIDIAKPLRAPGFLNQSGLPDVPGPRLHLNISPKL